MQSKYLAQGCVTLLLVFIFSALTSSIGLPWYLSYAAGIAIGFLAVWIIG